MGNFIKRFLSLKTLGLKIFFQKRVLFSFLFILSFLFFHIEKVFSAPQTPSQALPKMFKRPPGLDLYEFKKKEKVIPTLPQIEVKQQEDTGIKINLQSIIILAPKNLQNIIEKNKYVEMAVGMPVTIRDLYEIALEIEKDFNKEGFPLVRVILPVQELEPEQATIFFKVIGLSYTSKTSSLSEPFKSTGINSGILLNSIIFSPISIVL